MPEDAGKLVMPDVNLNDAANLLVEHVQLLGAQDDVTAPMPGRGEPAEPLQARGVVPSPRVEDVLGLVPDHEEGTGPDALGAVLVDEVHEHLGRKVEGVELVDPVFVGHQVNVEVAEHYQMLVVPEPEKALFNNV